MTIPHTPHIQDLILLRRRAFLGGLVSLPVLTLDQAAAEIPPQFASVAANVTDEVTVPIGYRAQVLIAWGDTLFESVASEFDPNLLTRAEQEQRFGQNNDMLALFPIGRQVGSGASTQYLMCVNHEYVDPALTFPSLRSEGEFDATKCEALFAAVGVSVVRVEENSGIWRVLRDAQPGTGINRRITPFTPVHFSGPAREHRWISAAAAAWTPTSNTDAVACGTLANCAGGQTPWGTFLTAEENFDAAFWLSSAQGGALESAQADAAWIWTSGSFGTPLFSGRSSSPASAPAEAYDVAQNPYAPSLYGWVVEIDPFDVTSTPRKRTALGRMKHECATTALTRDLRVAVYMGDDQVNEFVYKFVSASRFNVADRNANRDLLDDGQLYAARFHEDGRGRWLAITPEAANAAAPPYAAAFTDLGDTMMRAREAARFIGATPMDRPEDVEAIIDENGIGRGPVLVVCTNNRNDQLKATPNPRRLGGGAQQPNVAGHILRIDEDGLDCGASTFRWDVFALGGDPDATEVAHDTASGIQALVSVALRGRNTIAGARFACPDNICFDARQNVWIATDGSPDIFSDCNDSVLVTSTHRHGPRIMKRFLVGPVGAEICGPTITPDQRAFLACVQHPGESNAHGEPFARVRWRDGSRPSSNFPDGGSAWPRSAVIVATRVDGGIVGE